QANYRAIKRAREYIDDVIAADSSLPVNITLDELAVISDYSKWQITRDFRSLYGTTPYRYVTLKRLQKAKALIERGMPLSQASFSSGFADQSHMTRHFKKCFGTTPKIWANLSQ
uniref:helix-turn-helix domain-containing protein n=2 Tax=Idiomarina TaxID=135575 RepID=UPI00241D475F